MRYLNRRSLCVVTAAIAGCIAVVKSELNSTEVGTLVCASSSDLEFRPTSEGRLRAEVVLQNSGTHDVRIREITADCGCMSAETKAGVLKPGENQLLAIEINSQSASSSSMRFDYSAGKVLLAANVLIRGDFKCTSGLSEYKLNCSGSYRLPVTMPIGVSDLGKTSTVAHEVQRMVRILHKTPVKAVTVRRSSLGLNARVESGKNGVDVMHLLADPATLRQRHPEQEIVGLSVTLSVEMANGDRIDLPYPFVIRLVPPISVRPRRMVIGPISPGESIVGSVRLRPDGETIQQLLGATVVASESTARVRHIETEGDVLRVDIELDSLTVGLHSLTLPLVVQHDDGEKHAAVSIPVSVVVR
jgi:hypothetical protein